MTEMVTSGSMSGEGKRSHGLLGESGSRKDAARFRRRRPCTPPRFSSTLHSPNSEVLERLDFDRLRNHTANLRMHYAVTRPILKPSKGRLNAVFRYCSVSESSN